MNRAGHFQAALGAVHRFVIHADAAVFQLRAALSQHQQSRRAAYAFDPALGDAHQCDDRIKVIDRKLDVVLDEPELMTSSACFMPVS